ncbi:hypothetical protein AB0953_29905 [Streptomyces sp. NPDC046866]|uniref:hypothetical protein n=1 Tax=Streptomyces sp. NPDC046866 TaxID=3154921 RepID=UPI0034545E14
MSRSYWDFVLACAFAINAIGPAYDVWENTRGSTSDRLLAAHTSLAQQAGATGGATLVGVGVAAMIWIWVPIHEPVLSWIGAGATLGLLAGLHIWTARSLVPEAWSPSFTEGWSKVIIWPLQAGLLVVSAGLILVVSWILMQFTQFLYSFL